jgi:hypothetical protein
MAQRRRATLFCRLHAVTAAPRLICGTHLPAQKNSKGCGEELQRNFAYTGMAVLRASLKPDTSQRSSRRSLVSFSLTLFILRRPRAKTVTIFASLAGIYNE